MPREYDISNVSFLIVDDSKYMRSIIKTMLSGFGIRKVAEASGAAGAFEIFKTNTVDIIIIDQKLDTLDGNEFTQLVRTADDSPNPFIPIIMLTAYSGKKQVTKARDSGVTEFLSKPICARDLYLRVIETLHHPREFIRSTKYFGPDRRRSTSDDYKGGDRRKSIVRV